MKLHFFSQDEAYEIIYIESGQEALINHIFESLPPDANRLVILTSIQQSNLIHIDVVIAYCIIDSNGKVSYYKKQNQ